MVLPFCASKNQENKELFRPNAGARCLLRTQWYFSTISFLTHVDEELARNIS